MPQHPSRRLLLRALALGGVAVVLAGCDDDSTGDPPSPTAGVKPDDPQTWPADTELLISARARVHDNLLSLDAVRGATSRVRRLRGLWRVELATLEQLITLGGVPLPELAAAPTAGEDAAATSAPAGDDIATITALELARALRKSYPDIVAEIAPASPSNLALLTSLAAQQVAAAELLGAPVQWEPLAGPDGAAAVPLLAATRPAIFGLEVTAARSRGEEREDYEQILQGVRALTRHLTTLAGPAAPVAPLGYDLPEPLESAQQRRELARALVADIGPAALSTVVRLRGDVDKLSGVVRVVSEAVAWGRLLGVDPQPFPGMTVPA